MNLMRKILLILFVLTTYTASAQWTIINGNQRFAKGLGIPTKDTFNTYTLADTSQIVLRPQDSALYVHYKGRWQKIGGGGSGSVGTLQQVTNLGNTTTNAIKINSDVPNNIGTPNKLHLVEKDNLIYDSAYIDFNTPDYGSSDYLTNMKIKQENSSVDIGINAYNSSFINYDPYMNIKNSINTFSVNPRGFSILTSNKVFQINDDYFYFIKQSPNTQFYLKPLYSDFTRFHTLYTSKFDTTQVVDTIATLRDVRKGGGSIDTSSLSSRIDARVKYTDTASMLSKYVNLANYGLTKTSQTLSVDTSKISTLYQTNLKLNKSDTTSMLTPYLRKIDTTAMLTPYLKKIDTTVMLSPYTRSVVLTNYLQKSDSATYQTKYRSDTARDNTYSSINTKLNSSDSSIYQTKYKSDTARTNTYTAINGKLNSSDSSIYYTKYRSDTSRTNIYTSINGKISDTTSLQSKTLAAYSFQANKTNVNATATANTFKDTTGTYTGTPTWTGGTAPNTLTNAVFYYTQVGKLVTLRITMIYTNQGATNTRVQIPLTSNMPTPATPSGYSSTADIFGFGYGYFGNVSNSIVAGTTGAAICFLRGTATGSEIVVDRGTSGSGKYVWATITYFTN